jgi:UDP-3-O-[3-hydroxymyristoyl] N-acetylglucosamine deacetylase
MRFERTLSREIVFDGIGLHTGKPSHLRLLPAPAGSGRVFVRTDLEGTTVPATIAHVGRANYATCLVRDGVRISTAEHLLAALYALGVDNARLEIDTEEVPILDGSATPFVDAIERAGVTDLNAPRRYLTISRPLTLVEEDKQISVHPSSEFRITYAIDFEHPLLGYQELTADMWGTRAFVEKLAPARTFVLERDVAELRRAGLAKGGNLDNAVVIGEQENLSGELRYADEPVRHKMLDLTGDLSLLGYPLKGHVIAYKAGHDLHAALAQMIDHRTDSWYLAGWDETPASSPVRAPRSEIV